MPGATPNRAYTYPALGDAANVPFYMQQLATDIDTDVELTQHPPLATLNRTATQTTSSSTPVAISWTAADTFDSVAGHNPAVNPSRYVVAAGKGGIYAVRANLLYSQTATVTGTRSNWFRVNGVATNHLFHRILSLAAVDAIVHNAGLIPVQLVPGDYVECWVDQNSATTINVTGTMDIWRVSE